MAARAHIERLKNAGDGDGRVLRVTVDLTHRQVEKIMDLLFEGRGAADNNAHVDLREESDRIGLHEDR